MWRTAAGVAAVAPEDAPRGGGDLMLIGATLLGGCVVDVVLTRAVMNFYHVCVVGLAPHPEHTHHTPRGLLFFTAPPIPSLAHIGGG